MKKFKRKKSNQPKKKIDKITVILLVILAGGIMLLSYPTVADLWNTLHSYREIKEYTDVIENMDTSKFDEMRQEAYEYNERLLGYYGNLKLNDEQMEEYKSILDINGSGMMGYIYIPKLKITLPIYHQIEEDVLRTSIGHLPGTSLPVGGESTHCVLTGHRGLPSAKLFSDVDRLREGDVFMMNILDETLTYEVDQIRIVLPEEIKDLMIEEGQDYCTLVTCTPYGVNTHRLLIRGHRIETDEVLQITADAVQLDSRLTALAIGSVFVVLLVIWMMVVSRLRSRLAKKKEAGQETKE